ncbi:MAG: hypothetical protein JSU00_29900 [Acidobacteria bacterium]|nr:hypothetical protein [Acidobacteriota bacterium]
MLTATCDPGVEEFKTRTFDKLKTVRCPVHHQIPRLRIEGATLREVRITMSACCNRLAELANKAIAS